MPLNTNIAAGMFEPSAWRGTTRVSKASNITMTRGDIANRDTGTTPDSYRTAPTSGTGPFVWVVETVLSTAAKGTVSVIDYETDVYVTNDAAGSIEPGAFVQTSATVAGRIMASAGGTTGNRLCGRYLRHAGQDDGATPATALGPNEVGIIRFLPNSSAVVGT